jgi:uncharacterized cupin superfamily protein
VFGRITEISEAKIMTKRIKPQDVAAVVGTLYPSPFDEPCRERERRKLGDVAGLSQFGVNLLRLPPGVWSSQRHWHSGGDEFIYVLSGEVVLATDAGEEILVAGEAAGFKAGEPDGHCLKNQSDGDALVLEIGSRVSGETGTYSDIDMIVQGGAYLHKDGTPYPVQQRRGPNDA